MTSAIAKKYEALTKDLRERAETGNKGSLTHSDMEAICKYGKELIEHHCVKTVLKNVADYFRSFGFKVVMDFDDVNYDIVEV